MVEERLKLVLRLKLSAGRLRSASPTFRAARSPRSKNPDGVHADGQPCAARTARTRWRASARQRRTESASRPGAWVASSYDGSSIRSAGRCDRGSGKRQTVVSIRAPLRARCFNSDGLKQSPATLRAGNQNLWNVIVSRRPGPTISGVHRGHPHARSDRTFGRREMVSSDTTPACRRNAAVQAFAKRRRS